MEILKKNLHKWIAAIILLVVGILCIVAAAASGSAKADAYDGISITLGVSLLVVAGLVMVLALVAAIVSKGETSFANVAIGSSVTLALGIFFIADKGLGGQLIWLFLNFVPYVLIVVGAVIVVDAILVLIFGVAKKQVKVAAIAFTVSIIIGALALVLGALMVGDNPTISKDAQLIVFGIILCFYAALICLSSFLGISVVKNVKKNDSIDAEVKVKEENNTEAKAE